jgi:hypothetical protein
MICFPQGTNGFVGTAYIGGAISWYGEQHCERISITAHELGHNFGLEHSKITTDACKSQITAILEL